MYCVKVSQYNILPDAIDKENTETQGIEKNIRNLRNDMIKLNQMLHFETGAFESLDKDNILTENEFMAKLKEAELNSIQMQAKLDSLKEEKERLLNSLVESECVSIMHYIYNMYSSFLWLLLLVLGLINTSLVACPMTEKVSLIARHCFQDLRVAINFRTLNQYFYL